MKYLEVIYCMRNREKSSLTHWSIGSGKPPVCPYTTHIQLITQEGYGIFFSFSLRVERGIRNISAALVRLPSFKIMAH